MYECIIDGLESLNEVFNGKLLPLKEFKETKHQLSQKEVLISYFGDSNVGKSTLLNAILGN